MDETTVEAESTIVVQYFVVQLSKHLCPAMHHVFSDVDDSTSVPSMCLAPLMSMYIQCNNAFP